MTSGAARMEESAIRRGRFVKSNAASRIARPRDRSIRASDADEVIG